MTKRREINWLFKKISFDSMTRVKRGYTAQRRQKKIHLFASTFIGAHSRLTRITTQQRMRALVSSHRDSRKKIDLCRLWITQINAVTREDMLFYSYSLSTICMRDNCL